MNQLDTTSPSVLARVLGYAGLIPFVALSLASWLVPGSYHVDILRCLVAYGAAIVSFIGALHWGAEMGHARQSEGRLIWGVLPSLVAWVSVLVSQSLGLAILVVLLIVCFFVDRLNYPRMGLAAWLPMRRHLTVIAALSCSLAWARTMY